MFIGIILLFVFLFLGMPIAFALGVAGVFGLVAEQGITSTLSILMTTTFRCVASYTLVTIPLFVLMAELLSQSGLAKQAYVAAYKWMGHTRGGLAIATVLGGAVFGACSGSSTASCATFGSIAVPEMRKYGYNDELSSSTVALAGTLAAVIPPSILLVVYGVEVEASIGKLLIAGLIPGIMLTGLYAFGIWLKIKRRPDIAPMIEPFLWSERWSALRSIWPLVVIALLVLGCLYTGITTPTEAAAVGAVGTFVLGLITRTINIPQTLAALKNTCVTSAWIFTIIIGAQIFTYFLTFTGASQAVIESIGNLAVPGVAILLMLVVVYVILGMFLPSMGTMLLTLPLVGPILFGLGYDPIWFGVFLVILLEIGLCTPPVGINCFVTSGVCGVPLEKVFKGVLPMLAWSFVGLGLLILFPHIALFLPSLM